MTPKTKKRPDDAGTNDLQAETQQLDALADLVVDRLLERLIAGLQKDAPLVNSLGAPPLHDETLVHQDSAPMDRDQYLRMARRGDFPSFKDGKKVFAFWREVRRSLGARFAAPARDEPTAESKNDTADLCRQLQVVSKART